MYLIEESYESCYYDLWQMNVDLDEVLSTGSMKPSRIAMLLFNQPPGSQVWKEIGGWYALTPEEHQLTILDDHVLQIAHGFSGSKSKGPQPTKPPIGRIEQRALDEERQRTFVDKATVHKERLESQREEVESALAMWGPDWNKGTSRFDIMRNEANQATQMWEEPASDN